MDYKKSGAPKSPKGTPKYNPHKSVPKGAGPSGTKAALLARMKAAASKNAPD